MAVILMVMDKRMENFSSIRAALAFPLAPLQYIVSWPTQVINDLQIAVTTRKKLVKENFQLKLEQLQLRAQVQRLMAIESENIALKSLMQSAKQLNGKTLIAELLAVNSDPFINQVLLNKGSRDGVYAGQPILDANGIMGQITQVGPITSRALLLNDPHSGIAVEDARNGTRAIAVGDANTGKMRLIYVPKTADIRKDDMFISSGLGDHYPKGYPVGRVLQYTKDPAHQFATIILEPSARLDSSRHVLLLWYTPNA
jgi:rod shape-determining protein MreC